MGNYYCFMAAVPELSPDGLPAGVSIAELREELECILSDKDRKTLFCFFLKTDCMNLVHLLERPEEPARGGGVYSAEQYEDLVRSATEMNFNVHRYPAFMSEFARGFAYNKSREGYFPKDAVLYAFYQYAMTECPNALARDWYKFNLDVNNILTALLARRYGWNPADFMQGDSEVTDSVMANLTVKDFGLGLELDYAEELTEIAGCGDPVRKERMTDALRWKWLEDRAGYDPFTMDAVFAYLCKLEILERWSGLDAERGKETFQTVIENLRGGARVPEEFL